MSFSLEVASSLADQLPLRSPGTGQSTHSFREAGLMLCAILLLTLLLVGITYGLHRMRSARQGRRRQAQSAGNSRAQVAGSRSSQPRRRRRRRSNPTLAEAGGLPPKRPALSE